MEPALTFAEARRLLGVEPGADARTLRRAWARALQASRPDAGGDEAGYRWVIAAFRLLETAPAGRDEFVLPPATAPRRRPVARRLELTVPPSTARSGGWRRLSAPGLALLRVRVPSGVRDGQALRLRDAAPGGDILIVLRVPRVAAEPPPADSLRRRFQEAWAA